MTSGRWERIKHILELAWQCERAERAAFLDRACTDEPELRVEVEALLASDDEMGQFLAQSALAQAGTPDIGKDSPAVEPELRIGPYRTLREIGNGGMGTVYLAERADGQFRKRVAIKVVNPHLAGDRILRRFRNERRVLAALDHPNIARLLDGGATEDGRPYLVMQYVDGMHIDAWCDSHNLTVRERLQLFRTVCDAVQYAHIRQVIHRDIKPGNILVTVDGIPQLLDFGIAKVLDPEMAAETVETVPGPGPMTPEYASPEQVRAEAIGPASDIYSLGVVLYRLVTGRLPYSYSGPDLRRMARVICDEVPVKPSAAAAETEIRGKTPHSVRRLPAGDLDHIVLMALRKTPEERYGSAAQLSEDLRRLLENLPVQAQKESATYRGRKFLKRNRAMVTTAALSAAFGLAMALGVAHWRELLNGGDTRVRSIAVLPLENLTGDKEQEYFADGITETLIGDLAQIRGLRVISRTSAMSYKNVHKPLAEIARQLGVQMIAEGSVLRAANHVRIMVRLIDPRKDGPVWSGKYDGELDKLLLLQSEVAEAITGEIHLTLTHRSEARDRQVNLGAYDAYLKGRHQYFNAYSRDSMEKAIAWFRRALDLDSGYAPAYAALADCYWGLSSVFDAPRSVMPKAKWAATKAIELDDTLGEAHGLLGRVEAAYEYDRAAGTKEFRRAIELKPGDAQIHLLYGIHLAEMGQFDAAVAELDQAQKLDPVSSFINAYVGIPLYFARRYGQIVQRMRPLIDLDPENQQAHAILALALEQEGESAKAISEMENASALDPDQDALSQLGHMYAVFGRTADARRILSQLLERSRQEYVSAYNLGVLYAGLGEREEAFRWLQKIQEDRSEWFAAINVDPRLYSLHSDPRFESILRSAGLAR